MPDHSLTYMILVVFDMPANRFDEILKTLHAMESSYLDRWAIQKLFGVQERRARQLMAGLPGFRAGNACAVNRLALVARLEETAQGGVFQWETNRRARVVEELGRTRRELTARSVRIPAAASENRRLRDLSSDIKLRPGELRIEFFGAEDLAAKLFELSKAMAKDWQGFVNAVERKQPDE